MPFVTFPLNWRYIHISGNFNNCTASLVAKKLPKNEQASGVGGSGQGRRLAEGEAPKQAGNCCKWYHRLNVQVPTNAFNIYYTCVKSSDRPCKQTHPKRAMQLFNMDRIRDTAASRGTQGGSGSRLWCQCPVSMVSRL